MVHVVRRSTNPAMHDRLDFQSLYPQLKDIILTAHPAPYALEDYPYLRPSARTAELEARAAQADTREARWALLEILEKGMPKTAAADFVKSEAGQAFLRELEGDDREYARLFLEELPGCKRLVGSLLGSGSQEPTK